ncbi:putative toxin-antitoxin system toxin component, PIN family [Eubacterium ramulus]|uniref:putative toxin-antitoxin system toxin component, PIN family n=1 Tax=Eubacterium ramulus TaxID=39490 RepID=UPI002EB155D7|nr:putative toxin-antitoxin system toxin component, PIN family [Muricomes sp.]
MRIRYINCLVVIDTNVLISALLSKHSDAATVQVLNAVFDGTIIPVFNDEILAEYDNVLHRPKFKFPDANIQLLLDTIKTYGVFAKQLITNEILPDPKDLVFYEVVMAKQDENAYLVTGNSKHFPKKPFIVTPNELLDIMK